VTRVLAYVPDLMDRSKVAAAAPGATFVTRPDGLAAAAADAGAGTDADLVVVVDLTRAGVLEVLPALAGHGRLLGFANHTARDVMDSARAAGCEQVLARSAFFSRLEELLG